MVGGVVARGAIIYYTDTAYIVKGYDMCKIGPTIIMKNNVLYINIDPDAK